MFPVHVAEYPDEGTSLGFAEVAHERYLTSGTDSRGITKLVAQSRTLCVEGCRDTGPEIPESQND